jgi:hypothetical protein
MTILFLETIYLFFFFFILLINLKNFKIFFNNKLKINLLFFIYFLKTIIFQLLEVI